MERDIYSPDSYAAGTPHEVFDALRAESPVAWQDTPEWGGYFAVLTHEAVVQASRDPAIFSASTGGVVIDDLDEQSLQAMRGMLLAMDPPRHGAHRKPLAPSFKARVIGEMEGRIREICGSIFDEITASADGGERGDSIEVDFVHDVTARLPSQVMGELMGLPEGDWMAIHKMAERNTSGQDPDYVPEDEDPDAPSSSFQMISYGMQLAASRRGQESTEDLTTILLESPIADEEAEGGERYLSDLDFGMYFSQLVTAGNDTTKTMLSSGLHALLDHPEQFASVRADTSLLPGAVEEILRWANPLHYFRRTATADTVLAGQPIAAGDKVVLMYSAANRDPLVFENPHVFDISRSPNPHLSFGIGGHFCLGAQLARLEGRVFFDELFTRFGDVELVGEPVRLRSNLNNALKRLPVRLTIS